MTGTGEGIGVGGTVGTGVTVAIDGVTGAEVGSNQLCRAVKSDKLTTIVIRCGPIARPYRRQRVGSDRGAGCEASGADIARAESFSVLSRDRNRWPPTAYALALHGPERCIAYHHQS